MSARAAGRRRCGRRRRPGCGWSADIRLASPEGRGQVDVGAEDVGGPLGTHLQAAHDLAGGAADAAVRGAAGRRRARRRTRRGARPRCPARTRTRPIVRSREVRGRCWRRRRRRAASSASSGASQVAAVGEPGEREQPGVLGDELPFARARRQREVEAVAHQQQRGADGDGARSGSHRSGGPGAGRRRATSSAALRTYPASAPTTGSVRTRATSPRATAAVPRNGTRGPSSTDRPSAEASGVAQADRGAGRDRR